MDILTLLRINKKDKYTKEEEKYRKTLMEKLMKNPEFKKLMMQTILSSITN